VSSGAATDPNPGNNSATDIDSVTPSADVAISKTVDNPTPGTGTNVAFTISASNNGPAEATAVQVTDLLPAGLSYVSDNGGGSYNSGTGVWNIGSIANGSSAGLSLVATVTRTGALINQATKTAQGEPDPNPSNNTALIGLNAPALADIQVQKTVDNAVPGLGSNVTFTITAKNAGPANATGVQLTDLLPASLTYFSDTGAGSYNSVSGVWTVGSLANGATATLQIVASVNSASPITNIVTKTAEAESDYASGNDAASVTLNGSARADLSLSKTASQEPVASGSNFTYTIVVVNYGPAAGTGVTVTDNLPAGVAFVSATPSQGSCTGTTSLSCTLGTISAGGSAQLAVIVTKTVGGPVNNVASVTANETDPNVANNSNGEDTTPVQLLGFSVE
jgi:uncharacterized repeat protein (TIGR01451 family)